jgi:hypothetical protein
LDAREKKFLVVEKGPRVLNETVILEIGGMYFGDDGIFLPERL